LPPHSLHGGGYVLRPGFTGCLTAGNPVPSQPGHLCSVGFAGAFFIRISSTALLDRDACPATPRGGCQCDRRNVSRPERQRIAARCTALRMSSAGNFGSDAQGSRCRTGTIWTPQTGGKRPIIHNLALALGSNLNRVWSVAYGRDRRKATTARPEPSRLTEPALVLRDAFQPACREIRDVATRQVTARKIRPAKQSAIRPNQK
jgi:hypothetical protein